MSRIMKLGEPSRVRADLVFTAGADAFFKFRYEVAAENGGIDGKDLTGWDTFMAIADDDDVVDCDSCVTADSDGYVTVHLTPDETSQVSKGCHAYNIALRDTEGVVTNFAAGEVEVHEMVTEVTPRD